MGVEGSFSRATVIGVVGAGAMGGGIAEVAANAGHSVVVGDVDVRALAQGEARLRERLARDVEKGRRSAEEVEALLLRVRFVDLGQGYAAFARAGLVVEAVVEREDVKGEVLRSLEAVVAPNATLATNTSSLSVTALAAALQHPARVLGLHFFNPASVMPLVEVVQADATDAGLLERVVELAETWKKTPVVTWDTPGFIVNRIARPFYGEALRLLDERLADVPTIDWALRELGGFRMGPFELMDFIGNDVNYAVTCSVFEAFYYDPRYRPSLTQKRLIDAGRLGKKSGRGYYDYRPGAEKPEPNRDRELGQRLVDRVVAMLINEAADALYQGVASRDHIDLAMTKGVNYPKGLLRWGDEIGPAVVLARLDALKEEYAEDRYRPCPLLRRMAHAGGRFYP